MSDLERGQVFVGAIVQTCDDPREQWSDAVDAHISRFEKLAEKAVFFEPGLIVFPECAIKTFVSIIGERTNSKSVGILNRVSAIAKDNGVAIFIGALEAEKTGEVSHWFNSALLFDERGNLDGIYRKREFVPFGETDVIGWLAPTVQETVNRESKTIMFDRGGPGRLMSVTSKNGNVFSFGVLVCFESMIPSLSHEYARNGADFLVNITDDLWSLTAAGMFQHAVFSVFRAIETRLPVVRASNGGYRCTVDPVGRVTSRIRIFREGVMPASISFLAQKKPTIVVLYGDWFACLCIVIALLTFLYAVIPGPWSRRVECSNIEIGKDEV
jgi:apolipoprotein N-acyltransferase